MSVLTKDAILKVALTLFGNKGYHACSIRDIAQAADVNVAAINYHFGSKEKLFHEVINAHMLELDNQLQERLKDKVELKDALWEFYLCLLEHKEAFLSVFRLFLSSEVTFPDYPLEVAGIAGPPGAKYLFLILERVIPGLKTESYQWGVQILTAQLFHSVLMQISPFGQQQLAHEHICSEEYRKYSLSILSEAIIKKCQELG